jgi:hypothetical protein
MRPTGADNMAYISGISFHHVTGIEVSPVKENQNSTGIYLTRTITISIGNQQVEITCFSETASQSDDSDLMPLKI